MPSTIIIKHGSASNAPSSLTQGELAINVSTGKLYYGSGSQTATSVNDDFNFGQITSSGIRVSGSKTGEEDSPTYVHLDNQGNISASGDLAIIGHISSSGNTRFGNDATDSHTFTGHITGSGNIS